MSLNVSLNQFEVDLHQPIDIGIPLRRGATVNAFYLPDPQFTTVKAEGFVGDVNEGGTCNVENLQINPHGNGTHTECVGHISSDPHYLKNALSHYHFLAAVGSVPVTETQDGAQQVTASSLQPHLDHCSPEVSAFVIRTIPNTPDKPWKIYSGTQPPFLAPEAAELLVNRGIQHVLIDLPSLDHEDDPYLKAHHAFFAYPENPALHRTITEMVYVPDAIEDGPYLLNLQVLAIESDASPSHPVLYRLK